MDTARGDAPSRMLIVAAGFPDPGAARQAESALRASLDVAAGDLALESAGGDVGGQGLREVLAGRIREHRLDEVERIVSDLGGRMLDVIPEWYTRTVRGGDGEL